MTRDWQDYGNHLNENNVPMCRHCRLHKKKTLNAERYSRRPESGCPFCKKIKEILKEIKAAKNKEPTK